MQPYSQERCPLSSPRSQPGRDFKIENQAGGSFEADPQEAVFVAWNPSPYLPSTLTVFGNRTFKK